MKKNSDAKMILLATGIAGVFSLSSNALAYNEPINIKALTPLEKLTPMQRGQVRGKIGLFIDQNPHLNIQKIIFAVDKNGEIYVLDKDQVPGADVDPLAQPSCIE
jgi:hypothetical protein